MESYSHVLATMLITEIDPDLLAGVHAGMNIDGWLPSENIEDRRGMSLEDSMNAVSPQASPLEPLIRSPGDLSSQAGLDDIGGGSDLGDLGF